MAEAQPSRRPLRLLGQVLTIAFVVVHATSGLSSILRSTIIGEALELEDLGKDIRKLTRKYDYATASYQTWSMFAANPPKNTRWFEVELQKEKYHQPDAFVPMTGEADRTLMIGYDRMNKLERTLMKENRHHGRVMLLNHICAQQEAKGEPVARVHLVKRYRRTAAPSKAGEVNEATRELMLSLDCP